MAQAPVLERPPEVERTDVLRRQRYRYAMISSEIRRDLEGPLAYFQRLEVHHLFRTETWKDLRPQDFGTRTRRFSLPTDLFWKLRQIRPDIIQGPEPLSLLMLPFLLATLVYLWLNPAVKLVTLSLEPLPLGKKYHPAIVPFYRLILRWWFKRASVIFWFDEGSRRNLLRYGAPPEKMVYQLYGCWGLDLHEFSPDGPMVTVETDDPVILYLGRLNRAKGVHVLLDAFELLGRRGVKAHLVIAGDGDERARLRAQAERLALGDRVSWFGEGGIKNVDVPRYLRAADLFVMPSITSRLWVQLFSVAAWEAMACGLPVIVTRTGSLAEFTPPEAGVLIPERDTVALADALEALVIDDATRRQMSAEARAYAERRFDSRRNVELAEKRILEWCGPA
jgi:glycosyltransferase involved in cell wall biosynthesis